MNARFSAIHGFVSLRLRFAWLRSGDDEPGRVPRLWVRSVTRVNALVWLILVLATVSAAAAEAKRVLIVHSFGSAAPPFTTHSLAFETELTEKLGERVDLDEVSLDMARYADLDMQEALVEYLLKRQEKWQPDLVVPVGSPAGVFVARYRDRLFPETPIIYTGMDGRRLPPGALQKQATFVGEDFNLPGFVEDILQVAPATTNIAVVIGASPLEQYWAAAFRQEFAPFTNRVSFTWLNELPFDQMLERVSQLPPQSFIFVILLLRDASGVTHNADEALRRIHEVANAPVNSIFQHQLGLGIVGGRLYQAELEGVESARIAIRVLRGEPMTNFPPVIIGPLPPRYDWRELQRWNISEDQLPPGSTVLFRVPTVWDRYRSWIVAGLSVCVLQAVLIFGLLANRFKRRRAERSLEENRNRLRTILDTSGEGILTINERGVIESVNAATEKIFGYAAAEMLSQNVAMLLPSSFQAGHIQSLAKHQLPQPPQLIGVDHELSGRRKDGSTFPLDLAVNEIMFANRRVFTVFVRDITERKQAEETAREFGGRLLHAQEAERARLARELHDDITQRLARLAIDAGRVESGREAAGRSETLREVRDGLVRLSEDVHSLSYRLHPALLEDLGLADALKAECERFTRSESISVEVQLGQIPAKITPDTGLCLFRVMQEALRNVARHARAKSAKVSLRLLDDGLQLAVADAGAGFDPRQQRPRPSLGLASMHERVRLLGGELDIESAPGHGTTIVAWVPLKSQET
jgi:PAS domain S-box-containing protein